MQLFLKKKKFLFLFVKLGKNRYLSHLLDDIYFSFFKVSYN